MSGGMFDRLKMPGLGEQRNAETAAQLDARAEFNAKLIGELGAKVNVQIDQMSALLSKLDTLIAHTPGGAAVAQEFTYNHVNTTDERRYFLEVPAGSWRLARILAFAVTELGVAATPSLYITGLFGRNRFFANAQNMPLMAPISTRELVIGPSAAKTAGCVDTLIFVLEAN